MTPQMQIILTTVSLKWKKKILTETPESLSDTKAMLLSHVVCDHSCTVGKIGMQIIDNTALIFLITSLLLRSLLFIPILKMLLRNKY